MDISAFLDQKLSRRFRTYDRDGDGFVDREDFVSAAARLGAEFGHAPDSPVQQRMTTLCLGVWEHLVKVADVDGDQRISEAEYKAAFAAGLLETPAAFDAGYQPFLAAIMDIADADHDGWLTEDDEVRWTGALMGLPEADARAAFQHLDRDGDGYITTGDLLAAIRAYYFDEAPGSAGSWLLGPLAP
ncbi:EF-hand domain-containing protein [Actinocrispum sp. NPDC049592]|uniref:EF-hand domain-containing protein n=1 Tax=Actinocrispum sp. NPDC049592 TaxID=3154835 RepID=UPI0034403528